MSSQATDELYQVWAADNLIYGPIDLTTLQQWVTEQRVLPATWVYSFADGAWHEAQSLSDLDQAFGAAQAPSDGEPTRIDAETVSPGELRQFAIFAGLSDEQLQQFVQFGQLCRVSSNELFIKKGDPGDALFFILEGSVRARLMIGREDRTLGEIPAGQFFGEMAMFNHAPRSADVVGHTPSRVFRLSSEAFLTMVRENPAVAAPILFALASTMAARVSEANSRFQREVSSGFLWS